MSKIQNRYSIVNIGTSSIITSIKLARLSFPDMQFAGFLNLWQITKEIENLSTIRNACTYLEQQNQFNISKIIQELHKINTPLEHLVANTYAQQIQFSSIFSLVKKALEFFNQGFVIICDDVNIWKQLNQAILHFQSNTTQDWIQKLYIYARKKNLINAVEMLRHPQLTEIDEHFCKLVQQWEYTLRQDQEKSVTAKLPGHPLADQLLNINCKKEFPDIFKDVCQILPHNIQRQLLSLGNFIELLDGSPHCLEWFKEAINLENTSPKICLGLHEALKFKPEQVIFCLQHNQINTLQSRTLFKKPLIENLLELLHKWSRQVQLNILAYAQEEKFQHPLVLHSVIKYQNTKKLSTAYEKPIATPSISSRPLTISATGFNQLMQDPYGFYARYILKLKYLERLGVQTLLKDFGLITHKLIEVYLKQNLNVALNTLHSMELSKHSILWKGRLERILYWVHTQVNELHPNKIISEQDFQIVLETAAAPITLKARIDAYIAKSAEGLVVNFKTGAPPSKNDVLNGYAPQLAIEMLLASSTFNNHSIQGEFWQLKGTLPAGTFSPSVIFSINALQTQIEKIISHYLTNNSPFLTCPWPSKTPKYNEYKNLERIA